MSMNTTKVAVPNVELAWRAFDRNHRIVTKRKIVAATAVEKTMKKILEGDTFDFMTRDAE